MNTTDVLDRLFAAFDNHPQVTPQLLADAHSTIHQLTAQLAAKTRDADGHLAEVWKLRAELGRQHTNHDNECRRLYLRIDRLKHGRNLGGGLLNRRLRDTADDRYRDLIGRIATQVRNRRAAGKVVAPSLVDTHLLLTALKEIDAANRLYDDLRPPLPRTAPGSPAVAVVPERMSA